MTDRSPGSVAASRSFRPRFSARSACASARAARAARAVRRHLPCFSQAAAPPMMAPTMTAPRMIRNSGWVRASAGGSARNGSSESGTVWRLAIASRTMTGASGTRMSAATSLRIMGCRLSAAPKQRSIVAVQALAHFLAGLEEWHGFLVDRDARAGARVAAFARRPFLDRERPEAAQLDAVAPRQGSRDLAQDGVDDILDIPLIKVRILRCDPLNELGFDHCGRPLAVWRPGWFPGPVAENAIHPVSPERKGAKGLRGRQG